MISAGARYELGARLGSGAAADVYRAHDRTLGRDVALKLLRPAFAEDPELVNRFEREASAVSAIQHPNIVGVLDHGLIDGTPYLAMECVDGQTLQQLIRSRGRFSEDEACRIGVQIASALEAAHSRGVIHRDLKPANVLVATDGTVKVSDFGIAHLDAATQLTRTGEVLGTPRYVAPEQIDGHVDARTDLYALGIVLYELVTGSPPFDGDTVVEIVTKQLRARPMAPRAVVPGISRALDHTIMRALEKSPSRRFASAGEMRSALEAPVASAVPAMATRRPARRHRPIAAAPIRAGGALATGAVALVAFAGIAFAKLTDAGPFAAPSAPIAAATANASTSHAAAPTPTFAPSAAAPVPTSSPALATAAIAAADPRATVSNFYALVSAKRYDDAAALWSARMKAAYPPASNIYGRFDPTSTITLRGATVASQTDASAILSVDIVEVMKDGSVRQWIGQWTLARAGSVWLMDFPALRRA